MGLVTVVGWTSSADRTDLWQPQAPKSYTKPDSRDAWVQEAMQEAPYMPFVGKLDSVSVLDENGQTLFASADMSPADVDRLLRILDKRLLPLLSGSSLVGIGVKKFIPLLAAMAWRVKVPVSPSLWRDTSYAVDPMDAITPSKMSGNGWSLYSMLNYFNFNLAEHPNFKASVNPLTAEEFAQTAWLLAKTMQVL